MPKTVHGRRAGFTDALGNRFKCTNCTDLEDERILRSYSCQKVRLTNGHIINYSQIADDRREISLRCKGTMCRLFSSDGVLIGQFQRRPHTICPDTMSPRNLSVAEATTTAINMAATTGGGVIPLTTTARATTNHKCRGNRDDNALPQPPLPPLPTAQPTTLIPTIIAKGWKDIPEDEEDVSKEEEEEIVYKYTSTARVTRSGGRRETTKKKSIEFVTMDSSDEDNEASFWIDRKEGEERTKYARAILSGGRGVSKKKTGENKVLLVYL